MKTKLKTVGQTTGFVLRGTERTKFLSDLKKAASTGNSMHVATMQNQWIVFRENTTHVLQSFPRESDAIKFAQGYLKTGRTNSIAIHAKNGNVKRFIYPA